MNYVKLAMIDLKNALFVENTMINRDNNAMNRDYNNNREKKKKCSTMIGIMVKIQN